MKKYISFIASLILSCCLISCTEEQWVENGGGTEQQGGLPIEFVMDIAPTQPLTRTDGTEITIEGEKTAFENGDIIQIVANFYCKDANGTDNVLMPEESICTMLQYQKSETDNMGKWVNYEPVSGKGKPLYWPWKSEGATFQAFYYPGFNGFIDPENETLPVLLDSVDIKTNPLIAEETVRIPYGNAVHLKFNHICTRLVLTDLDDVTGGANYSRLWMENNLSTPETSNTNAFKLRVNKVNSETEQADNGKLSFEYSFIDVQNEEQKVLIGGRSATISKNNSNEKETAIIFFLPEGNYSDVTLTRRFGRPLLNWKNVTELKLLETGKSYIVSLNELKGNITIDDDDDWWEDDQTPIKPETGHFDLNKFLQCIEDGVPYSYNDKEGKKIIVLEEIEENHLVLTQNIDFNNETFTPGNISSAITLDGNGHYFSNVKATIFTQIEGKIQNLGLKKCNVSIQLDTKTPDFGLLTKTNRGTIENIRLSEINVTVTSIENGGTYEVGSLVADSQGPINNIEMDNVKVTTSSQNITNGTLMLGGLVGQTAQGAPLEKVQMYSENMIEVTNNTKMENGSVYTGGLVGLSSSNVKECNVRANVNTANATGTWLYTGGLVGSMRNQIDKGETEKIEHILLEFSQNIGTVTGGECKGQVSGNIISTGHSATGGLVGYSLRADIKNCIVDGKVTSYIGENHNNETHAFEFYTIGGLAGAVRAAESEKPEDYPKVENNYVYTTIDNTLPNDKSDTTVHFCKVGWLAGIAPTNVKEEPSNSILADTQYKNVGYPSNNSPSDKPSGN